MKKTINFKQNYFSYEGLEELFNRLCAEYTEYKDQAEFWKDYDEEEFQTIEDIEKRTDVILVGEEGFIIRDF
jgi:SPX domain protein involved in polyphosphate accumulation|tara:strand:+ start:323 stop:538 length:216 start_codon:yes stop_codon:yes gene_type:complete